jgi:hypothetical protein
MQDEHIGPVMLRVLAMLVLTPIYAAIFEAIRVPLFIAIVAAGMSCLIAEIAFARSDGWVVERQIRFAPCNDGVDVFEVWPGYEKPMKRFEALSAADQCASSWPDYTFRVSRARASKSSQEPARPLASALAVQLPSAWDALLSCSRSFPN